jgi:hypothetical protein
MDKHIEKGEYYPINVLLLFAVILHNPRILGRMLKVVKGARVLGNPIKDNNTQVVFLKQRLDMFAELLEAIDPEEADLEDIDRMIQIVEEMDAKCREFKHRDL